MLTNDDIFRQSVALQQEGNDIEEHDKSLLIFVKTFGSEFDIYYAMALIELNRMIETF